MSKVSPKKPLPVCTFWKKTQRSWNPTQPSNQILQLSD